MVARWLLAAAWFGNAMQCWRLNVRCNVASTMSRQWYGMLGGCNVNAMVQCNVVGRSMLVQCRQCQCGAAAMLRRRQWRAGAMSGALRAWMTMLFDDGRCNATMMANGAGPGCCGRGDDDDDDGRAMMLPTTMGVDGRRWVGGRMTTMTTMSQGRRR